MHRTHCVGAILVTAVFAAGTPVSGGDPKADGKHHVHFQECAKACADCMRECEMCARHCAHKVAAGHKEHMTTLGTCADCAEFCAASARIVSRHGPMAALICQQCARACDVCGAACERFPDDAHMQRCAKECRECAQACREMLKHTDQNASGTQAK